MTNYEIPKTTPWGDPQTTEILAPGIVQFTTASHGGIWLSPERNAQVPARLKRRTFLRNGLKGWYEEDCDAEIVFRVFGFGLTFRSESTAPRRTLADIAKLMQRPAPKPMTDQQVVDFLNAHANDVRFTLIKRS